RCIRFRNGCAATQGGPRMLIGVSSLVRAGIDGRLGVVGVGLCSRIAVSCEIVLDGEARALTARNVTGQTAWAWCQERPSGRGEGGGHEGAGAVGGAHRAPPLL